MAWREPVATMRRLCRDRGDAAIAAQMQQYLKHVVKMHGLKAPAIQAIFKETCPPSLLKSWSCATVLDASTSLLRSEFAEEKKLGIHLLQQKVRRLQAEHVAALAPVIDAHVYDWATCDSLASSVIRHVIKRDEQAVEVVLQWRHAKNVWRKRCSCVAFVALARHGRHNDAILTICEACVACSDRFVQLGVGWLLRELGRSDLRRAVVFIVRHSEEMSSEGRRYAVEKMQMPLRTALLQGERDMRKLLPDQLDTRKRKRL